jgi:hypothetical protein
MCLNWDWSWTFTSLDISGSSLASMWVVAPTGSLTIFDSNVTDMFRVRFATATASLMTLYAAVLLGFRAFWFYARSGIAVVWL